MVYTIPIIGIWKRNEMSYKNEIQEYVDDLAYQRYGKDFYDLTEE